MDEKYLKPTKKQMLESKSKMITLTDSPDVEEDISLDNSNVVLKDQVNTDVNVELDSPPNPLVKTRVGRLVRKPKRLDDFLLDSESEA